MAGTRASLSISTPNEMLGGFKERARSDGKLQNFPERKR